MHPIVDVGSRDVGTFLGFTNVLKTFSSTFPFYATRHRLYVSPFIKPDADIIKFYGGRGMR